MISAAKLLHSPDSNPLSAKYCNLLQSSFCNVLVYSELKIFLFTYLLLRFSGVSKVRWYSGIQYSVILMWGKYIEKKFYIYKYI